MPLQLQRESVAPVSPLFACTCLSSPDSDSTLPRFGRGSQLDANAPEHLRAQGLPGYKEPENLIGGSLFGLNGMCGTVVQRAVACADDWVAKQLKANGKVPPSAVCACDVRACELCVCVVSAAERGVP